MRTHYLSTPLTLMSAGTARINSLTAGSVNAHSLTVGEELPTTTVVGYSHQAPTPIGITSSLLTSPGLAKATSSSDPNLLTIPDGANIIAVRYKGDGLVGPSGGSAFDLGISTFDGSASSLPLIVGGTETIANTGAGGIYFTANSSGASGAPGLQVTIGDNFVILGMRNTPITAGTLIVEIDYIL